MRQIFTTYNWLIEGAQFQIVVCQNVSTRQGMVQGVLAHEMIHMFDYCRNQLDFKNMEHLACTEIRAANLTHCSFASAWSQGDASWGKIKKAHQVHNFLIILTNIIKLK